MNNKTTKLVRQISFSLILAVGAFITVFPFVYMLSTSLKGPQLFFELPPQIIPTEPTFDNFIRAWISNNFSRYFLNSLEVTIISTFLVVWLSSMMAYAFARFDFYLKKPLFYLVMLFMIMPSMTLIVPQFFLAVKLKLIDRLSGLVLLYVAQNIPLSVFLLKGFIEQISVEIEEAAKIDGASYWDIYWRIIIPLTKPALATSAIFASLGAWDEYVWAMTILNNPEVRTLPVAIAAFQGVHSSDWGLIFAASIISITPIILLFISMQRYFTKGITAGAVKG
jgi:multiple sugar transport system permease protein